MVRRGLDGSEGRCYVMSKGADVSIIELTTRLPQATPDPRVTLVFQMRRSAVIVKNVDRASIEAGSTSAPSCLIAHPCLGNSSSVSGISHVRRPISPRKYTNTYTSRRPNH